MPIDSHLPQADPFSLVPTFKRLFFHQEGLSSLFLLPRRTESTDKKGIIVLSQKLYLNFIRTWPLFLPLICYNTCGELMLCVMFLVGSRFLTLSLCFAFSRQNISKGLIPNFNTLIFQATSFLRSLYVLYCSYDPFVHYLSPLAPPLSSLHRELGFSMEKFMSHVLWNV